MSENAEDGRETPTAADGSDLKTNEETVESVTSGGEEKDSSPEQDSGAAEPNEGTEVSAVDGSDGAISDDGEIDEEETNRGKLADGADTAEKKEDQEDGEIEEEEQSAYLKTYSRAVCKFFHKGQCTWGASCRFLHPGVHDKGNYNMFPIPRPHWDNPDMLAMSFDELSKQVMAAVAGEKEAKEKEKAGEEKKPEAPKEEEEKAEEKIVSEEKKTPKVGGSKEDDGELEEGEVEPARVESSWELGIRAAKERIKKAQERRKKDVDFEEKKLHLGIGQPEPEDTEMEAYFARVPSPVRKEESIEDLSEMYKSELKLWRDEKSRARARERYAARMRHYPLPMPPPHLMGRFPPFPPHGPPPPPHLLPPPPPGYFDRFERDRRAMRYPGEPDRERDRERGRRKERVVNYGKDGLLEGASGEAVVKVERRSSNGAEKPARPPRESGRGEEWTDPWARGKAGAPGRKRSASRSSSRSSRSSSSYSESGSSSRSSSSNSKKSGSSSSSSSSSDSDSSGGTRKKKKEKTKKPVARLPPGVKIERPPSQQQQQQPRHYYGGPGAPPPPGRGEGPEHGPPRGPEREYGGGRGAFPPPGAPGPSTSAAPPPDPTRAPPALPPPAFRDADHRGPPGADAKRQPPGPPASSPRKPLGHVPEPQGPKEAGKGTKRARPPSASGSSSSSSSSGSGSSSDSDSSSSSDSEDEKKKGPKGAASKLPAGAEASGSLVRVPQAKVPGEDAASNKSRREQLLKQLKAVQDAIEKKKAKKS